MTVTSTPLHDDSVCISCGVPATVRPLDPSHIIARSQAPDRVDDPTNIVLQCRIPCHELIGAKKARQRIEDGVYVYERWSEEICDFEEVTRVRVVVDKKRGHLVPDDSVLSDGAEARGSLKAKHRPGTPEIAGSIPAPDKTSAPSPSTKEEGNEAGRLTSRDDMVKGHHGAKARRDEMEPEVGLLAEPGVGGRSVSDAPDSPVVSTGQPTLTHDLEDWSSQALADRNDHELAEEFHDLYRASSVLRLESYRRIDAYRLKHEVMGEAWVNAAEDVFDLRPKTLYGYSRAWQAFEEQARQSDFSDALLEMGGGAWQVIGRAPREQWEPMAELALNVVADRGIGRGLASAVAARAQEEGLLPAPKVRKWSLEELQNQAREYGSIAQAEAVLDFLQWLGEQA